MDSSSKRSSTTDRRWWQRAWIEADHALDVVFPPTCIECEGLIEDSSYRHICAGCAQKIILVRAPHCRTCGYPFFGMASEDRECAHCAGLQPRFGEGRTATLLQGPMRRLVHAIKYENSLFLLADVSAVVRANPHFCEFLAGACLVPVPLHPRKRRERGYNQAELIARCFALAAGAEVVSLLERRVWTSTQTRLDREQRQENLKEAFARDPAVAAPANKRLVLVDDVFTTGATLNACAIALRRSGIGHVDVATLGHG